MNGAAMKFFDISDFSFKNWVFDCIVIALLDMPILIYSFLSYRTKSEPVAFFVIMTVIACSICFESMVMAALLNVVSVIRKAVLSIMAVFFVADGFLLAKYGTVMDKAMFQAVLDTNFMEIWEYIQSQIGIGYFAVITALAVLSYFFVFTLKKGFDAVCDKVSVKRRFVLYFAVIFGFGFFINVVYFVTPSMSSLYRIPEIAYDSVEEISEYREIYGKIDSEKVEITQNSSSIPYVVFVLGESTSRSYMSIYGYHIQTTPCLGKRLGNGELILFDDVVGPYTQTVPVLKFLFTFYRNDAVGKWYDYMNIFDIMKKAGYHTVWISNQETSGIYGNVPRAYADRCDEKHFTMVRDSMNKAANEPDEKIFPLLDGVLNKKTFSKNFFVIHLMGTHEEYRERYTEEYGRFDYSDETGANERQRQIRAEYDNAVLYNDHIVDEIIRKFEDKNAIVIYISDHGEDVYEDGEHRGHYPHGTMHQLEIPMIVWFSEQFRNEYTDIVDRVEKSAHRPYMTDDMIHSLLDLTGIETGDYDPAKSVFNVAFDEGRKRMYEGKEYMKGSR